MSLADVLAANGYVVVPAAVPKALTAAVVADIEDHFGRSVADPQPWYGDPEVPPLGFVTDDGEFTPRMFHYPSMWAVREHPAVHAAFAEILGTEALWVSIANVCVKLPVHPDHPDYGGNGFIHFDRLRWSLSNPDEPIDQSKNPDTDLFVSGVVALTDTTAEMGGFQCVPGIYRRLDDWLAEQPDEWNPRDPNLSGYEITPIPLHAGDLCIWTTRLPHGNGNNTSSAIRLAQYVTMNPAPLTFSNYDARRASRIEAWQTRSPQGRPAGYHSRELSLPPPPLSDLGRKLLGLDEWKN
ncbi:MAG: phytanoyl-CoA dioxygenase family protein [Mycobacterium sp.]|nr:phytanoyl-CoA dioxygenase family protein [Mycobacterium sp.]